MFGAGLRLCLRPSSCDSDARHLSGFHPSSQCKVPKLQFLPAGPPCKQFVQDCPCWLSIKLCAHKLLANLSSLFRNTTAAPCGCRGALLADQDVLMRWRTPSPLLIMGSHTWNTPNEKGELKCGGPRQDQILEAARHRCSVTVQMACAQWVHCPGDCAAWGSGVIALQSCTGYGLGESGGSSMPGADSGN